MAEKGGHWVKNASGGMSFKAAGGASGPIGRETQKPWNYVSPAAQRREARAAKAAAEMATRSAKRATMTAPGQQQQLRRLAERDAQGGWGVAGYPRGNASRGDYRTEQERNIDRALGALVNRGLARKIGGNQYRLTDRGKRAVNKLGY